MTETSQRFLQLVPFDFVDTILQGHDGGGDFERLHPLEQDADFLHHHPLSLVGFLKPFGAILLDPLFEVVDVEQESVVDVPNRGVDVPRDGNVDQEHRAARALAQVALVVLVKPLAIFLATSSVKPDDNKVVAKCFAATT